MQHHAAHAGEYFNRETPNHWALVPQPSSGSLPGGSPYFDTHSFYKCRSEELLGHAIEYSDL